MILFLPNLGPPVGKVTEIARVTHFILENVPIAYVTQHWASTESSLTTNKCRSSSQLPFLKKTLINEVPSCLKVNCSQHRAAADTVQAPVISKGVTTSAGLRLSVSLSPAHVAQLSPCMRAGNQYTRLAFLFFEDPHPWPPSEHLQASILTKAVCKPTTLSGASDQRQHSSPSAALTYNSFRCSFWQAQPSPLRQQRANHADRVLHFTLVAEGSAGIQSDPESFTTLNY